MILRNFKPKKMTFWPFLLEKYPKIHKIGGFGCKKSLKFEENPKINIYSLVPQIDHPVALWKGKGSHQKFNFVKYSPKGEVRSKMTP